MRLYLAVFLATVGAALLVAGNTRVRETVSEAPHESPDETPVELPAPEEEETYLPQAPATVASGNSLFEGAVEVIKNTVSGGVAIFGTKYDTLIKQSADQAGIDWQILWRLLWKESRFREDIITGAKKSPVGALGIAQFMPATAREWLGSEAAALDPRVAIPGAARYLAWLIRKFGGNVKNAVAAYNWGIGNMQKLGAAKAPAETRDYVVAITGENLV